MTTSTTIAEWSDERLLNWVLAAQLSSASDLWPRLVPHNLLEWLVPVARMPIFGWCVEMANCRPNPMWIVQTSWRWMCTSAKSLVWITNKQTKPLLVGTNRIYWWVCPNFLDTPQKWAQLVEKKHGQNMGTPPCKRVNHMNPLAIAYPCLRSVDLRLVVGVDQHQRFTETLFTIIISKKSWWYLIFGIICLCYV